MDDASLRKSLVNFLQGGQAAVTVEDALDGLAPEHRHVRAAEGLHSIWEELEHMRIAQEDILRYTLDASWQSPKWPEGYWPGETKDVTDQMWSSSVNRFLADRKEMIHLAEDASRDLTSRVPHGEWRTYLRQILLTADHNSYHLGQIVQTRKLLGDWRR